MKLDLWLWDMLLQGREFRNKTNENWTKLMNWSGSISDGLDTIYLYVNKHDGELNKKIVEVEKVVNARVDELLLGNTELSEVVDARVDAHGITATVLSDRLNREQRIFEQKSSVHFDLTTITQMDSQDIGILLSKTISDVPTVCFLNVSSTNGEAQIQLEKIGETIFSEELSALIFAKIGEGERYQILEVAS
ncbi:alpha-amylase [Listeria seeligeri]|uniref:alpha-amylase n=1 Tax=Listeria seeligeri TaxID=1640 RepID=UPI0015E7B404|nr:alpha-amylase [Listeria seeligeri]